MLKRLDIGKSAVTLLQAFGDGSAMEALRRCEMSRANGNLALAADWQMVLEKVVELQTARPRGPLH